MEWPRLIKSETDYEAVLARIEKLMDAKPDTPEGDELELLAVLVELYEDTVHPVDLPDPVSAVRFRMAQNDMQDKDLIPYIGSASKVSEVMSGRRGFSLAMIRNLVSGLGIPAEVFLAKASSASK